MLPVYHILFGLCTQNRCSFHENGYACRYQKADLVKLDVLLNGQPVDALATIVHNLNAQRMGRQLVEKLTKFIERFL